MWSGQGQGDPYAMQRAAMGASGYQMGMSSDPHLRMRQEQMIQAQQARRMQQQAGGGGMYPAPGMMPPPQPGMPPGYPPTTMNMPPGGNRPMKMH